MRRTLRITAAASALLAVSLLCACSAANGRSTTISKPLVRHISGYPNRLSPEAAAAQSTMIVEGLVTKVRDSTWNTKDRTKAETEGDALPPMIYTPFTVKIDKAFKGNVGASLDLKAFGGVVGDESMVFEDQAYAPKVGDRVIVYVQQVFTEKNGDTLAIPVSLYTISDTTATNRFGGDQTSVPLADIEQSAH